MEGRSLSPASAAGRSGGRDDEPAAAAVKRPKRDAGLPSLCSSASSQAAVHKDPTAPSSTVRPTWSMLGPDLQKKILNSHTAFDQDSPDETFHRRDLGAGHASNVTLGDKLIAKAEHGEALAWDVVRKDACVTYCDICQDVTKGAFNKHCESAPHQASLQLRADGFKNGEKEFVQTRTLRGYPHEEISLLLTGSNDGAPVKSTDLKRRSVTLISFGAQAAKTSAELYSSQPNLRADRGAAAQVEDFQYAADIHATADALMPPNETEQIAVGSGSSMLLQDLTLPDREREGNNRELESAMNTAAEELEHRPANGTAPVRVWVTTTAPVNVAEFMGSNGLAERDVKIADVQHKGKMSLSRCEMNNMHLFDPSGNAENEGCVNTNTVLIPDGKGGVITWSLPDSFAAQINQKTVSDTFNPTIISYAFSRKGHEITVNFMLEAGFLFHTNDRGHLAFRKDMSVLSDSFFLKPLPIDNSVLDLRSSGAWDELASDGAEAGGTAGDQEDDLDVLLDDDDVLLDDDTLNALPNWSDDHLDGQSCD